MEAVKAVRLNYMQEKREAVFKGLLETKANILF